MCQSIHFHQWRAIAIENWLCYRIHRQALGRFGRPSCCWIRKSDARRKRSTSRGVAWSVISFIWRSRQAVGGPPGRRTYGTGLGWVRSVGATTWAISRLSQASVPDLPGGTMPFIITKISLISLKRVNAPELNIRLILKDLFD